MNSNAGAGRAFVDHIPLTARLILWLGCGNGELFADYRRRNPQVTCIGVDKRPGLAGKADSHLDDVVIGDIERRDAFDAVEKIIEERGVPDVLVIEGQVARWRNPVAVMRGLRSLLNPQGRCVMLVENSGNWQGFSRWLAGDQRAEPKDGLPPLERRLGRQQLVRVMKSSGWSPIRVQPLPGPGSQRVLPLEPVKQIATNFGLDPDKVVSELSVSHWLGWASAGPKEQPLHITALGLRKIAGVTEARIDYPMAALNSLADVDTTWSSDKLSLSPRKPTGVLVLHRQFLVDQSFVSTMEGLAARGWILVLDMDDDPHHWREYVDSDFFAFRAVHAVTVSTEPLARMVRQWNPNVTVFPNAIFELPCLSQDDPVRQRARIFFGALNRGKDWGAIIDALIPVFLQLAGSIELVVVHDRQFFDALPGEIAKTFSDTLPPAEYFELLASCDIALLPLEDSAFNRLKSDLKFIECCAAGVVPVCSPVVYADDPRHHKIGVFAEKPEEWRDAVLHLCRNPDELHARRQRGRRYVKAARMHAHQVSARRDYYADLRENREMLEHQRQQRLAAYQTGGVVDR